MRKVTRGIQYEGDGHIKIVLGFGKKEVAPLRIFEMSIDDGVQGEDAQVYDHESPSNDEDVHFSSEEEIEDHFVSTEALVELLSTEYDPITSAADYRVLSPNAKSGWYIAESRHQMIEKSKFLGGDTEHTHLVKNLDYSVLQKAQVKSIAKKKRRNSYRVYF
ncbi:hypothetical protein NPIL_536351 [Nephila pilipes]|uniref:RED-like N-terminal domain-containing protein n=1 Tax=Nephila pilipes TaxID=299642 RepID=A0A8X6MTS5_NEPPI|nr:hypothetical protein NPIL_536351 [Nephila pilipes]